MRFKTMPSKMRPKTGNMLSRTIKYHNLSHLTSARASSIDSSKLFEQVWIGWVVLHDLQYR